MPDFNFLMESRLRPEQLRVVNQLGRLAANQGLNLYLAGGAVRDLTIGSASPRDLHFVMEGNIQKILRPLESKPARRASSPTHPQAGDSTVVDLHAESINLDAKANWSGKARTLISFPTICVIYYFLQAPNHWYLSVSSYVVYVLEALSVAINLISIGVYTQRFWPALGTELKAPKKD